LINLNFTLFLEKFELQAITNGLKKTSDFIFIMIIRITFESEEVEQFSKSDQSFFALEKT
jgi:hypothetical protein